MLRRFRKKKVSMLDKPIEKVLASMKTFGPEDPEYPQLMDNLERLNQMKERSRFRVSPDTIVIVAGNLLGILIIVAYEQKHVMVSKAMGFLRREPRI